MARTFAWKQGSRATTDAGVDPRDFPGLSFPAVVTRALRNLTRNDGARVYERRDGHTVTRADLTHRQCHGVVCRGGDSVHAPVHARGAHLRHL
jgi:hypothetical protein